MLVAGFATLLLCAPVWASENQDEEILNDDGLDDEEMLFDEIPSVYAASKYEQKVTEAPASVSVVTADEIRKFGHRTLADILNSLRGFSNTYDRNYDYIGVRGFGRPGDYNSRLLLLLNGTPLNDNVYYSAAVGGEFPVDVDLIDRVEVVRGPSSSIYGTSAIFGVINVITKRGRDLSGAEVAAAAGSHDTYEGRFSYGDRMENGLELLLSGSYLDSDGDNRLYYPEFDDPATNNGVAEDGDGQTIKQLFASLSFKDLTFEAIYGDYKKDVPTAAWDTVFNNNNNNHTNDSYYYFNLKYEHEYSNGTGLLARVSRAHYNYKGDYVYDWAEEEEDPPYLVTNKDKLDGNWWNGELQLTRRLWQRHRFTTGVEIRYNDDQNQENHDEEVYLDDHQNTTDWGIYLQDEFQLRDDLILNFGLRYDDYDVSGSTLNPRLAVIYNPWEKTTVKLLYGSTFKAPSAYELYYHDGYWTQRPAEDLDSETIKTLELVLEQQFNRQFRGVVNLYKYKIEDLIELNFDPTDSDCEGNDQPGCLYLDNTGDVDAYGLELELEGKK